MTPELIGLLVYLFWVFLWASDVGEEYSLKDDIAQLKRKQLQHIRHVEDAGDQRLEIPRFLLDPQRPLLLDEKPEDKMTTDQGLR